MKQPDNRHPEEPRGARARRPPWVVALVTVLVTLLLLAGCSSTVAGPVPSHAVSSVYDSAAVAVVAAPGRLTGVGCPPGAGCPNRVLRIDARKMPFVAQNIENAIDEGAANILSRGDPAGIRARRAAACGGFRPNFGGSCDEFPFASSAQGGAGARTAEVPAREQNCQGGTIAVFFRNNNIEVGQGFIVNVVNKDAIPPGPYAGVDVALDKGACE